MSDVVTMVQILLGLAGVLALVRAVQGPHLVDRIVALDLVLLLLAGGLVAHSSRDGSELFFGAAIVVALVAFAGTVIVARFIEWRDT
ncbi:MAG: monovalent cation/H+ antiporter complex subunit F [Acidimicrobiia bacterium]|nr:monovalent cation/H+ antiporter complex subunit F [Acidimicrobiia bacterium]